MKKSNNLTINKIIDEGKLTLSLSGSLDTNTAPDLEKLLNESLGGVNALVFDLTGLKYISSAGLRILLASQKKMAAKGSMKVVGVGEAVMEIFDFTGFNDILTIE